MRRPFLLNRCIAIAIIIASVLLFTWYAMNMTCERFTAPGTLEGTVIIRPLCPVEPCSPTQEQIAEAFAARKVVVYEADGSTVIQELAIDPDEGYRTALPPGTYIVDINHVGIDRSSDVPQEVVLGAGTTVRLDISIDTGIR